MTIEVPTKVFKSDAIRNGIAALGLTFTIGSALIGWGWRISTSLDNMALKLDTLHSAFIEFKCEVKPTPFNCRAADVASK